MSTNITFSVEKRVVTQPSRYKIEEESAERLVLRAKKTSYYLGGGVLAAMGLLLAFVGFGVVPGDQLGLKLGLGGFGLLLGAGGVALVRAGIRNQDRIAVDRTAGAIRWDMTREKDRHAVAFCDIVRLEVRREEAGFGSDRKTLYRVFVVRKDGSDLLVDEATGSKQMSDLARKASALCGVPFQETSRAA